MRGQAEKEGDGSMMPDSVEQLQIISLLEEILGAEENIQTGVLILPSAFAAVRLLTSDTSMTYYSD